MVTLQMSKGGFLPHILALWCLVFSDFYSKWPPTTPGRLTTYKFHTVLESKHRSGGILKIRGWGHVWTPSSHGNASKLEILLFNTMVFIIFRLLFKMTPTYNPGEGHQFYMFLKVDTPAVLPWKGRHNWGSPVTMVTLQMSKAGSYRIY